MKWFPLFIYWYHIVCFSHFLLSNVVRPFPTTRGALMDPDPLFCYEDPDRLPKKKSGSVIHCKELFDSGSPASFAVQEEGGSWPSRRH